MLDILLYCHKFPMIFLSICFLSCPDWVNSVVLSSSSLTLYFVHSFLLWGPFNKFFILVTAFSSYKISIWFFFIFSISLMIVSISLLNL